MTVAVACNLSDGVVLAADSAVTIGGVDRPQKIYENAEKLFRLADRPIGIAVYGLASLSDRTLGSLLHEFEGTDPDKALGGRASIQDVVESLRAFFSTKYLDILAPLLEQVRGKPYKDIPMDERNGFGLVVGGYSPHSYLSEVWEILIPAHETAGSATQIFRPGLFNCRWFAESRPIGRYIEGIDWGLLNELIGYFSGLRGQPFSDDERLAVYDLLGKYTYQIPFWSMPIEEGVKYARFLVELVINHYRYTTGDAIVGGRAQIGKVSYRDSAFQILAG